METTRDTTIRETCKECGAPMELEEVYDGAWTMHSPGSPTCLRNQLARLQAVAEAAEGLLRHVYRLPGRWESVERESVEKLRAALAALKSGGGE